MDSQPVSMTGISDHESQSPSRIQLRGPVLGFARGIWLLVSLTAVALCVTALVWNTVAWWHVTLNSCPDPFCKAHIQVFGSFHLVAVYYGLGAAIEILPWVLVGALIFWRKSHEPFALLFSLGLLLVGIFSIDTVVGDVIWEHFTIFRPLVHILKLLTSILLVLWYCFPDGKFIPRSMRWLAAIWIGLSLLAFILPGSFLDYQAWPEPLSQLTGTIVVVSIVVSLVYRYRRVSGPVERQQIQWVVWAGAVYGVLFAPSFMIWRWASYQPLLTVVLKVTYLPLLYLGSALFAVAVGIAILRYKLWGIDIVINRTLVYGLLTISVVIVYMVVVGVLGTAIQGQGNLLISILATGLVAVLVQPLRDRLQRGVNRMMYGERDDPVTVLSRLGERLEGTLAPDAVLPSLVEIVAQTLKLPYVAIESNPKDSLEAPLTTVFGKPTSEYIRFPLVYQTEVIGHLAVAPRAPGEALSPIDRHLLENIAHQAGMAVHAVNLTVDLQRSRQKLVNAREEERRRLRRDLHDGLGPNLASQGLKLAAVKQLIANDPASAVPLLDQVMAQNQSTVEEVRRLVYGLRPPALDDLGLVAAIRDYAAGMDGKASLQIEFSEPEGGLPALSAAVEVAAYRIVLEALTNIIRHARAQHCRIQFLQRSNESGSVLQIEIQDDGVGLPRNLRAGIGLRSMRERAEEVGGVFTVETTGRNGTCIRAQMPLLRTDEKISAS